MSIRHHFRSEGEGETPAIAHHHETLDTSSSIEGDDAMRRCVSSREADARLLLLSDTPRRPPACIQATRGMWLSLSFPSLLFPSSPFYPLLIDDTPGARRKEGSLRVCVCVCGFFFLRLTKRCDLSNTSGLAIRLSATRSTSRVAPRSHRLARVAAPSAVAVCTFARNALHLLSAFWLGL